MASHNGAAPYESGKCSYFYDVLKNRRKLFEVYFSLKSINIPEGVHSLLNPGEWIKTIAKFILYHLPMFFK